MNRLKKTIGLFVAASMSMVVGAQAASVDWQGGIGSWADANWTVDGTNLNQTSSTTLSNRISVSSGTVTSAGSLTAAVGGVLSNQTLTVSGDAVLNIGGTLDFGAGNGNTRTLGFTITNSAQVTATYLQLKTKNLDRTDIVFAGGALELTDSNSVRGGNFPNQQVNITAAPSEFTITANSSLAGKEFSTKVASDLFMLDGVRMTVAATGSDVAALNAELETLAVNGKYLFVDDTTSPGNQILRVVEEQASAVSELVIDPSDQLDIVLTAPATTADGTLSVAFLYGTSSNNVAITSVGFSNETHGVGSFSNSDSFPLALNDPSPSNETLNIQFDNTVAGLLHNESASGTVVIAWTELTSGITNLTELPVVASYDNAPTVLLLNPSALLNVVVADPGTSSTGTVAVSYTESAASPSNVVITAVEFTDTTHSVFSDLTSLPLELTDPAPSNGTLSILFDAAGFSSGETATGNVVVTWNKVGDITDQQSVLPVRGTLVPAYSGEVSLWGSSYPSSNVVVGTGGSPSTDSEAKGVKRLGVLDGSSYAKMGQEIKAGALTNGPAMFDSLVLRIGKTPYNLTASTGANQMQIWFGKIDETTGATLETYATETFDCSGISYGKWNWVQFELGAPVTFDPSNLSINESFAYQLWWTSEDPKNDLSFARTTATDKIAGGSHHEADLTATDTTFPVTMAGRDENRDLQFALMNFSGAAPEIGDVTVVFDGTNLIMGWEGVSGVSYAVQRKEDLVLGSWSNVVEGLSGVGTITVTNDTTDPQAFYRTIQE